MIANLNFLIQNKIDKNPRFQIVRRVYQDYRVLRTYNADRFLKWTEWKSFINLSNSDIDFAITYLNRLIKDSEKSSIRIEYTLVNNYPNIHNEKDYHNYILDLVNLEKN